MRDVLKNLIDGLNEVWLKTGRYWKIPCKAAITKARKRLGCLVMSQLFHQLVRPMATTETVGAFLNGLREQEAGRSIVSPSAIFKPGTKG